ncbi:MAG: TonB-dependent receptor [Elusimicrobiales bacterium]|nr:TonB-dependent receptor [Elusimicrobiales bacterium]
MRYPAVLALCLLFPAAAAADAPRALTEEEEFFSFERASLEELLDIKTTVASRSGMKLRETPGLVTVITREEIQASGARNLVDVLSLLPEFEFGVDVQGNLGLGVRGNWANEGKVLLLWDGQTYNEILYSTIQFDRFPVDQIEEIQIVKGPGSAVYGGFAELAVIDIRTRSPKSLDGSALFAARGLGGSDSAYAGYSFGSAGRNAEFSANAFWGESRRSGRRYTDFAGSSYNMAGNSDLRPKNVNLYAAAGGTSARLILDSFSLRERDQYTALISTGSTRLEFPSLFAEIRQSVKLPGGVTLEPVVSYMRSRAWYENDDHFPFDKRASRLMLGLTASRRRGSLDLLGGGEFSHDTAEIGGLTSAANGYPDGRDSVHYDNHAFFGQASFDLDFAKLIAGARYDRHSQYGASLVPRVAVTKLWNDFNFKAIYSQAFRAPSIENIRLNPGIAPERAVSAELEAGYKASDTFFFSGTLFHTAIKHPIIFSVVNNAETYLNYDRTGTSGAGFGLKYKRESLRADLNYLYQNTHCNRVDVYSVPGHASVLLGFPLHKVTLNSSLPLAAGLSLNPSAVHVSKRYAYGGDGALKAFGERTTANLNLQLKDRPLKRLTLNLGVRDIFNSNYSYLQPYDGGHAPLPAPARELFLKAAYEF